MFVGKSKTLSTVVVFAALSACTQGVYVGDPREIDNDQYSKIVTSCERRIGSTLKSDLVPCVNREMDLFIEARAAQIRRGEVMTRQFTGGLFALAAVGLEVAFGVSPPVGGLLPGDAGAPVGDILDEVGGSGSGTVFPTN